MAEGTVLAEIALSGDKAFTKAIESVGDSVDDTATDATQLSGALRYAADALDGARNDAIEASVGISRLARQTDDAGDEMTSLALKSGAASGAVTTFGVSTEGASVGVTSLSTSLTGALIPAAAALSTTLAPLAAVIGTAGAALGGLAAGFGTVLGSGALSYGEDLAESYKEQLIGVNDRIDALEEMQDVQGSLSDERRKELTELKQKREELNNVEGAASALQRRLGGLASEIGGIFADRGSGFAGMIRDGLNALPDLVRNTLDAMGGLDSFAGFLREMGSVAMKAIPRIAGALTDLGRDALPVLKDVIGFLVENGPSIFRDMVATTQRLAPKFMKFTDALVEAMPAILEFGTFILETVVPAMTMFVNRTEPLIAGIGDLAGFFSDLNSELEETVPHFHDGMMSAFKALIDPIGAVKDAIGGLEIIWDGVVSGVLSSAKSFIRDLTGGFNGLIGLINDVIVQANDILPNFEMDTFAPLDVPEFAETSTTKFSQSRQEQRQMMGSKLNQGSQKMEVEVSGKLVEENGEIVAVIDDRTNTQIDKHERRKSNRYGRNRPI